MLIYFTLKAFADSKDDGVGDIKNNQKLQSYKTMKIILIESDYLNLL